ncbi:MAG: bifunctional adenosylcobinamide kinase/adenosylcobinamide-phosphate guanylyltransferase [Oscillospiraceae bacterium]|jgi:adenosylcobinamide kinase/adenosylcobinamide-phosphate guanylyltransferase|nr:bifunctional adenosylcobinamide kinase/adenosylcobinamide-phosphate guanylyltransferase [Oscillospiraceae bacterium]
MRIFISGGCKNGKSYFAQRLAGAMRRTRLYYVATMRPCDEEDIERVRRHRRERFGWGFETVEQPENIHEIIRKCDPNAAFLLDSLTALLSNEMFPAGGGVDEGAAGRIIGGMEKLYGGARDIVVVSDFIYSDGLRYDETTERFRRALALIDRTVAARSDAVIEVAFSGAVVHRGAEELKREGLIAGGAE